MARTDSPVPAETPLRLIDQLLGEQRQLSAVEEFASRHERGELKESRYRELIPAAPPQPGFQYAFEVDLDLCTGCKACVTACHSLNGLEESETWRDVGLLVSTDWRQPVQQVVTTACHHCVDPACLNGCPVLAYEKDPVSGIVRHLDDQCIGCQYCILMCPYEVPKYSARHGIVRKCDLCTQRLSAGEAPACAQACPNGAIRIGLVETARLQATYRSATQGTTADPAEPNAPAEMNPFLPGSPDPAITVPTTRFHSRKPLPRGLVPETASVIKPQPSHLTLVWMLVLTQFSIGSLATLPFLSPDSRVGACGAALGALVLGLAISVLHLGRPLKAWRAFLGLRHSWMSREMVAFGLLVPLVGLFWLSLRGPAGTGAWKVAQALVVAGWGLLSLITSAMIYHETKRPFWSGWNSFGKFFGTALLLGACLGWIAEIRQASGGVAWPLLVLVASLFKFAVEHAQLRRADDPVADQIWPAPHESGAWSLAQSAILLRNALAIPNRVRFSLLLTGGVALPLLALLPGNNGWLLASAALGLSLTGELLERWLFFRAVVPPRMPGGAA